MGFAVSGCGPLGGSASPPASSTTQPPTYTPPPTSIPTPNLKAVAQAYLAAFNQLVAAEDPLIVQQNAESAGSALRQTLEARVGVHQQFDRAVTAIDVTALPDVARDLRGVLAANAAVENSLTALAARAGDAPAYQEAFPAYVKAGDNFAAATATTTRDLGLVRASPTP